ncbi:type I-C CRISPR-associated protein Cas7/Csd2 [Limobrevibacterium gyesilva]|uniref:Type I-C CRISPR-associated protein Cas7/Csd2 n=1 Tax=Limobrevibacterium gyesilva TaxID=2991712 RepID=A0AA41YMA0_9PROT|nr:type I-C CRISPR-associated protein Cas7/Csd2 [Limobrevibacterium gyesilva]MCW3474922.1 type I-C CRISPR-associated protein Cas7/Csd2 [Limobrevibacterium gyesilva]
MSEIVAPPIANRYDFVFLFDVRNGNPNGDPDAGNMPRMDPETGRGLVTDVAIKRKIRNYVAMARAATPGYDIYMRDGAVLNVEHRKAYLHFGIEPDTKSKKAPKDKAQDLTRWMCDNFFDVRTFGAVMSTEVNAGQVRGPVQLTFAESIDPIVPMEISITRSSVTNEKDALQNDRTMGRKHIVPYGLYRAHGFVSGRLANDGKKGTGFSETDLALVWEALANMFDHDRAAARGEMTARGLIVFKHDSDLGNAPAHKLLERVTVARVGNGTGNDGPPRGFGDYAVTVNETDLPPGITVEARI